MAGDSLNISSNSKDWISTLTSLRLSNLKIKNKNEIRTRVSYAENTGVWYRKEPL